MGTLYIVGTPIGNLEDITLRALRILREVTLIATEDTRTARILLHHYQITTPVTSLFEGNERLKLDQVLETLERGDVALISEAGMPTLSDPGFPLVRAAVERALPVVPVPGPSAHTAALVVAGLPTDRFLFLGFLPRRATEREAVLREVADLRATLVCYEAPHRLLATLQTMLAVLGTRPMALCRELTKRHEEIWRGDLAGAIAWVANQSPRGEYTLVIGGAPATPARWQAAQVQAAFQEQLARGLTKAQAAREVARLSGWPRREIYALLLLPPPASQKGSLEDELS